MVSHKFVGQSPHGFHRGSPHSFTGDGGFLAAGRGTKDPRALWGRLGRRKDGGLASGYVKKAMENGDL